MKKSPYIALLFSLLIIAACKKKELPPENDDTASPVFYAKCDVNGIPVNLQAGTNNYYMNSAFYQDTTKVYVYKAELKQKDCNNACGYAVTILINDAQISTLGGATNVNAGLKTGAYTFNSVDPAPMYYNATLTPEDAFVADGVYNWEFSDGTSQSGYKITHQFDANKTYSMKFSTSDASCNAAHMNVFNVGNPLQTTVKSIRNTALTEVLNYKFSCASTGQAPYQYVWDFGDETAVSTDAAPNHTYGKEGRFIAKLQLTDARNNTCVSYYQVSAAYNKDCSANYTADFKPVKNTKALSMITVLITDANGTVYSSRDNIQPSTSAIEIVSVEDYKANDQGEPTKKIKIKFNCTLAGNGSPLTIKNGEAVIAVAYK